MDRQDAFIICNPYQTSQDGVMCVSEMHFFKFSENLYIWHYNSYYITLHITHNTI